MSPRPLDDRHRPLLSHAWLLDTLNEVRDAIMTGSAIPEPLRSWARANGHLPEPRPRTTVYRITVEELDESGEPVKTMVYPHLEVAPHDNGFGFTAQEQPFHERPSFAVQRVEPAGPPYFLLLLSGRLRGDEHGHTSHLTVRQDPRA